MSRILFAGATGRLGAPVAAKLVAEGHTVRALVRNPLKAQANARLEGVELVAGDVCDTGSVTRAITDCDALYISLSSNSFDPGSSAELTGVVNLTRGAAAAGVGWIGYLSGAGDLSTRPQLRPLAIKHACETAVKSSGIGYTVFKPSHFFESLPWFLHRNRLSIPGRQPHRYHYLAGRDYARAVAFALGDSRCHGKAITLHGPEALTMREALTRYRDACLPGTPIGSLPLPMARIIGAVTRTPELGKLAELFNSFAKHGDDGIAETPCPDFPVPTTTLENWCARC